MPILKLDYSCIEMVKTNLVPEWYSDECDGTDDMNRTTSAPSSVLHYLLDKGLYFGLEFFLYTILFPNKKTDT